MPKSSHRLLTKDGVTVAFDLYQESSGDACLVICHGFFQSKETATFQRMAQAFAKERDVLCMDFRGHGKSSGLFTFSARENAELEAVLDWMRKQYRRIIVMGFSLGGAIAINTLSENRQGVCSLIAVSTPAVFEDVEFKFWTPEAMRTGMRGLEQGAGCRMGSPFLKKQRPVENIKRLQGLPVLFIHGTKDVIVGVAHSRRLFAAANEPKSLEIIEGGGHAEALFREDPQGFTGLIQGRLAGLEAGK